MGKIRDYFSAMGNSFLIWRKPPRLTDVDGLAVFCLERASYVAQTTLYGYLRTRAGLQHFNLFTDKKFTALLKPARTRLVLVCLDDLAVYASAIVPDLSSAQRADVAMQLFAQGIAALHDAALPQADLAQAQEDFDARSHLIDWAARAAPDKGIAAFRKSATALIELAPIIEQLKKYDDEIVTNSMHFKWHEVRSQLRARLDAHALLASLA
tara:strand:+ start:562 stop:1194 length:633 start_codon:yes stop_codon:yes gene_type:complete